MAEEIPLFPLGGVLLPYGRMPLQIFEQRYLDLVRSSLRTETGFGVVWIRRGSEVVSKGRVAPDLGDYGTYARIVDWDQLPNGLLGITIEGRERFELNDVSTQADGLLIGSGSLGDVPEAAALQPEWAPLVNVLRGLQGHPHVQGMDLSIDYEDAWQVAYTLVQLLPLEEFVKYELLGIESIDGLMGELDLVLNQISGEDSGQ